MLDFINDVVRRKIKPTMIFKRVIIDSDMKYYRLDYYSQEEDYCVLELFFNECSLVCLKPLPLLGDIELTLEDRICMSVNRFSRKKDYREKLLSLFNKEDIDKYFKALKDTISDNIKSIKIDGIDINSVELFLYPSSMVIVKYSIDDIRKKSLVAFIEDGVVDNDNIHPQELKDEINSFILGGIYV